MDILCAREATVHQKDTPTSLYYIRRGVGSSELSWELGFRVSQTWASLELSAVGPEKSLVLPSLHRPWDSVLALLTKKVRVRILG